MGGELRWTAIEDVARLRDGLGVPVPPGTPDVFTEPVDDPLADLVARYARTHGPFTPADVATRLGLGVAVAQQTLSRLAAQGRVLEGEFRPAGAGSEWCDAEVLRRLRRRSLAALRKEVEPVEPATLGRFLPVWQNVGGRLRGIDGVVAVVEQLAGCAVPASALEPLVLGSRVVDYVPAMLDELTATGEVLWAGHGTLPGNDGWVSLHLADNAHLTLPDHSEADDHPGARRGRRGAGGWWRLLLPPALRRGRRDRGADGRQGAGGGALGPGLVGPAEQRHARPGPGADLRRADRAPFPSPAAAGPGSPPRAGSPGAGPTCPAAPDHRPRPAGGRCCPTWSRTPPAGRTRRPRDCSSGTAWSPAVP